LLNLQESRNMEDSEAVVKTKPVSTGREAVEASPNTTILAKLPRDEQASYAVSTI